MSKKHDKSPKSISTAGLSLDFTSGFTYAPAPESSSHVAIKKQYNLFIGGKWVKPSSGKYFDTISPSTEQVLSSVADASAEDVDKAVEEALDAVGLKDRISQMPSDLSGGQRKRIGIARTLILKPQIMLYDEPTSGLDPMTSEEINELINEVQEKYNTSAIVITHDLTCAKNTCHRVAMLSEGKFLETGTFEEVFNTDDKQVKSFFNYNFIQNHERITK